MMLERHYTLLGVKDLSIDSQSIKQPSELSPLVIGVSTAGAVFTGVRISTNLLYVWAHVPARIYAYTCARAMNSTHTPGQLFTKLRGLRLPPFFLCVLLRASAHAAVTACETHLDSSLHRLGSLWWHGLKELKYFTNRRGTGEGAFACMNRCCFVAFFLLLRC